MGPLTRLFLGVIALAAILAAVSVGLPAHVTVNRSVVINAPESAIFPYLNNLRAFSEWSPWSARDPDLAFSYGGPASGQGAQISWTSNKPSIGTGSMKISESEPNHTIELVANFNGLDGTSSYNIGPAGSGSKVTWSFGYESGSSPLKRWKALMLDGLVGAELDIGLGRLKQKIEADRRPVMSTPTPPPEGSVSPQTGQPQAAPSGTAAPQPGAAAPAAAPPAAQPNASDAPKPKRRR
jgi:Polyketide cyclase / dehydrase and lipid transport